MATLREIEAVLTTLREVERSLRLATPRTPEYERLMDDAGDLEAEYQRLMRESAGTKVGAGNARGHSEA